MYGKDFVFTVQSQKKDGRYELAIQLPNKCITVTNMGIVVQSDNKFYQKMYASASDLTLVPLTSIVPRLQLIEDKMNAMENVVGMLINQLNQMETERHVANGERQLIMARMTAADQHELQLAQQLKDVTESVESKGKQIALQQQQLDLLSTAYMELRRFTEDCVYAVTPSGDAGSEAPLDIFIPMQNEGPEEANLARHAQDLFPPPPPPCMSIENMLGDWGDEGHVFS
jgi:hypothetical protein